jgi:adenine-specific DNA-methyltransferase
MARKINYDNWSREELEKELRRIKETKYGLVWHRDLPEEKIDVLINPDARTPSEMFPNEMAGRPFPVLKEIKKNAIETDKSKQVNLLIEGDNYHSLAVLNFTHQESIDCIYIDPPYNTGNDDFIYNDKIKSDYVRRDDPFRHSKWLAFMEKRLKLAKNLLKKDGVIFISIDDNEFAQLKLLCDEILGEGRMLGIFTWVRKKKGSNLSKEFRKITEYVVAYKGGDSSIELYGQAAYAEKQVPLLNRPNNVSELIFPANKILVGNGVKNGKIKKGRFGDGELVVELLNDIEVMDKKIVTPFKIRGRFRWSQSTVDEELENGSIFTVSNSFRINVARYNQAEKVKSPSSLLTTDDGIGTNEDATEELRNLFPDLEKLPFDYPKPTSLIKYLISSVTRKNKNAVILDFMAGSGTTGQAVLDLNSEDGGQRQFILCTNNENNICADVCYPRVKKIIEGYNNLKKEMIPGLGGNLKYYTCDFVEAKPTDLCKRKLVNESTEMLCIHENAFEPVENGGDFKIFRNGDQYLGIVFYEDAIDDFKKAIIKIKGHCNAYIFSMTDDPHKSRFTDIAGKVTLCAIPEVILKVYREIFQEQ